MKRILGLSSIIAPLLLIGCGSNDSNETHQTNVSFLVSDAPVDSADAVSIGFSQVELVPSSGESIFLDVVPNNPSDDYAQIDLLQYQGTDSALIVSQQPVPAGQYKNLILHITKESNVNYVIDNNGQQPLKQPSNKLQLGSFSVDEQNTQEFTIEFDLRQSLVMRGNENSNNGYILKPHGVTILDNDNAASLSGTVDPSLFCADGAESGYVYLYSGLDLAASMLIDLVDEHDSEFDSSVPVPEGSHTPVASTGVDDSGAYSFGYLSSGNYTAAFACDAKGDDPIQYDAIPIANPDGSVHETTLETGKSHILDFS
ncbi:DUF4382 domain-containing protein [Vibrio sp. SCSIO 43135]|uniref:DUF4382 domain-containing protein n=1 Tax=Vibrio paucivorans TaxID=2829489 RepID=A0A9X3HUE8_9VIBR|nr:MULTISPECIES: DUF4382 domain-containing protein [Vibrio]MCW8336564.1 DUF4382 domain-containing protein [Vibrio paucivorans]USD39982.1 DUF4382 domain-containing protein [Vibrio sp. SCSIO 43135]